MHQLLGSHGQVDDATDILQGCSPIGVGADVPDDNVIVADAAGYRLVQRATHKMMLGLKRSDQGLPDKSGGAGD